MKLASRNSAITTRRRGRWSVGRRCSVGRRKVGMSLIETVIAMSLGAVVLSALTVIVTRVLAVNSVASDHLSTLVVVGRLGEQFRDDAHAAAKAERDAVGGVQLLRLTLDDRTVAYTITEQGVERVVLQNNQPIARDTFVMPQMRALGFDDAAPSDEVTLLVARLAPTPGSDALPGKPFPITARLKREARPGGDP